jgi:outer membrane receptor protein involved in Fe transport
MSDSGVDVFVPINVAADNFYNPFGVEVLEVRRRLVELGPRSLVDDSDMTFAAGTVRNAMDVWKLEGMVSWRRSTVSEHISHVTRDDNIAFALGPSGRDAAGNIRCGIPNPDTGIVDEPYADCVPLDVFHGPGSITREMLDYITTSRTDEARVSQTQASIIARREIALGASAPAQLALGLESRSLTAHFDFPGVGAAQFFPIEPVRSGTVDQQDLIAEIVVPFSPRSSEGSASTLSLGGRLSRFESRSTIGSAFAALSWRLHDDVLARGRFTQVYRAPSAGELFLGPRERVVPIGGICSGLETQTFCSRNFVAASNVPLMDSSYVSAGNPDLQPERGFSASTGLVWNSPDRRERFIALDATLTRLDDAIRAPGVLEIIEACRDGSASGACSRLLPSLLGGAIAVDGTLINGGRDESARLDLEARDGGALRWGNWRAELFASYLLLRRLTDINGNQLNLRGTFDVTQSTTGVAYPALEGQARLQWNRAPWTLEWSTQYIGSYDEVRDRNGWLLENGRALRGVSSVMYHDLSLAWSARPEWGMRLNIENVFDRAPPFVNNGFEANTDAPTYRLEGRLLSASIAVSF